MVSGAGAPSSSREGGKGSIVVVKTSKKGMDNERYLDATQRYVFFYHHHLFILLIFRALYYKRGVIKALNASTFGASSSQSQSQSQTTANAISSASASSPAGPSSSSSFGLGPTFAHFRSQLPSSPFASQPDHQPEYSSGKGVGPAVGGTQAAGSTQASSGRAATASAATSDGGPSQGGTTRDPLYGMADRLSGWPSEKIEKAKRLRDQFLSKV